MKVTILRGLPGSGKSTWARASLPNIVCSADHFFEALGRMDKFGYHFKPRYLPDAHAACMAKFDLATENGWPFVCVDNTNTTNKEMAPYVELALARGYDVEIREFKDNFGSIHNVPQATIDRMLKRWENVKPEWEKYLVKG